MLSTVLLLVGALAAPAVALVMPVDGSLVKTFNVPGASLEKGFQIPEGVPNGLYSVYIDDEGVAHHERISLDDPTLAPVTNTGSHPLVERQSAPPWVVTCDGTLLDREMTDKSVELLKSSCGIGMPVGPGRHIYHINQRVAAYVCNHTTTGDSWTCTADLVTQQIQQNIASRCGSYRAGWVRWGNRLSLGQELMHADNYFCGRNH